MPTTSTVSDHQPSVALPAQALCVNHPEQDAQAACPRCGSFICGACARRTDGACPSCVAHQLAALPSLQSRGNLAAGLILATPVLGALIVGGVLNAFGSVEPGIAVFVLLGAAMLLLVAVALAAIVAFLLWQHLAVRTANALGHDIGTTPGWAVGWWFIPLLNLWMPYHVLRLLLSELGGARAVRVSRVGIWWTFWVASLLFERFADAGPGIPFLEEGSLARVIIWMALNLGAAMFAAQVIATVGRVVEAAAQRDVLRGSGA